MFGTVGARLTYQYVRTYSPSVHHPWVKGSPFLASTPPLFPATAVAQQPAAEPCRIMCGTYGPELLVAIVLAQVIDGHKPFALAWPLRL